ncbi:Glucose-induced degradation complex subunit [Entomophthora muscae]|nr:Glucose-induced degradation complex subunit [Entomophthora muscae]
MNYLVIEGYRDAAEKFSLEANISPYDDFDSIEERMSIRNAIQTGNIQEAIEKVNDINPEILDTNPSLYFHLQQQRLIELIRLGKTHEALEFAQEELAHRGEENPQLLEELEKTMVLLAFEKKTHECPVNDLLDYSHRQKTASELNAAILVSQSRHKDPRLPSLLKLSVWAQNRLNSEISFPKIDNLLTCQLEEPESNAQAMEE